MKRIHFFTPFLIPAWFMVAAEENLRLVDDGVARAVVVLPESRSPATETGAEILSDHLFQISGARLETVRENEMDGGDERFRILMGSTKATERALA